ncbi:MAG: hypothetical protein ACOCRK_08215 [bacterium]
MVWNPALIKPGVLQQYIPSTLLPYSFFLNGITLDIPSRHMLNEIHRTIVNNMPPVNKEPICRHCGKTNEDGVMLFLPIFLNGDEEGRRLMIIVDKNNIIKINSVPGMNYNIGDIIPSESINRVNLRIVGWAFFCWARCMLEYSKNNPDFIVPYWHPDDKNQHPNARTYEEALNYNIIGGYYYDFINYRVHTILFLSQSNI